jgi:hypothetical protein
MNSGPAVMDRRPLIEAIGAVLAHHGLAPGRVSVAVRSYSSGETPALIVFVRLNQWQPEALLESKLIEKHLRDTLFKTMRVRIGYVYWRIGSDVETPHDGAERVHVRAARRLPALSRDAEACGALPPPDAPVTDWSDVDDRAV